MTIGFDGVICTNINGMLIEEEVYPASQPCMQVPYTWWHKLFLQFPHIWEHTDPYVLFSHTGTKSTMSLSKMWVTCDLFAKISNKYFDKTKFAYFATKNDDATAYYPHGNNLQFYTDKTEFYKCSNLSLCGMSLIMCVATGPIAINVSY